MPHILCAHLLLRLLQTVYIPKLQYLFSKVWNEFPAYKVRGSFLSTSIKNVNQMSWKTISNADAYSVLTVIYEVWTKLPLSQFILSPLELSLAPACAPYWPAIGVVLCAALVPSLWWPHAGIFSTSSPIACQFSVCLEHVWCAWTSPVLILRSLAPIVLDPC